MIELKLFGNAARSAERLIVLPGGPGISNRYLNETCRILSRKLDIEVGLISLPGHDRSKVKRLPNYPQLVLLVEQFIVAEKPSYIMGHSFGAQILLEMIQKKISFKKAILVSTPFGAQFSRAFLKGTRSQVHPSNRRQYQSYWNSILPLYLTSRRPSLLRSLSRPTFGPDTDQLQERFRQIDPSIKFSVAIQKHLLFIEGAADRVFVSERLPALKRSNPRIQLRKISRSAHFPMVENQNEFINVTVEFLRSTHV
jgi:pimeloyl-ACP methyl ester carboxylesterase